MSLTYLGGILSLLVVELAVVEAFGVDGFQCLDPMVFFFQELLSGGGLENGDFGIPFEVVISSLDKMLIQWKLIL